MFVNSWINDSDASIRTRAVELKITKSSVHRALAAAALHLFQATLVQELSDGDKQRRVQFSNNFLECCNENPDLLQKNIFSDEYYSLFVECHITTRSVDGTAQNHIINLKYRKKDRLFTAGLESVVEV